MISKLNLEQDGAVRLERAALSLLPELETAVAGFPVDQAGVRIFGNSQLFSLLAADGPIGTKVSLHCEAILRPVRVILFDKSPANNWALGWHQDRTIAVTQKHEIDGFGPWSIKAGVHHVEPPFAFMERLRTIRIHLDDVDESNAPLLIAVGSHHLGKIAETQIETVVSESKIAPCHAAAGDIWLYATPILHASAASTSTARRRVLQVDYADFALPEPLMWNTI
jgi:hypothetical protein